MLQTETVHHLAYVNGDLPGFLNHLEKSFIDRNEGAFIATVNPEIGYAAAKDKDYFKTVSSADFILPDGIGIVLTSRLINSRLKSRIAGYDVFINLLSLADRKKKRVFLYGAKQEVIQAVADRLSTEYPGIEIWPDTHTAMSKTKAKLRSKSRLPSRTWFLSLSDILIRKSLFMNISIYFLRRLRSASAGASTCSAEK